MFIKSYHYYPKYLWCVEAAIDLIVDLLQPYIKIYKNTPTNHGSMFETDVIRNLVDFSSLLSEKCADSSKKWALIEPTAKKLILIFWLVKKKKKKKKKSDEN